MSISWSFSGFSGPTLRNRSFENLLSDMSHLPSASLLSPIEVWLWPGWYCTSSFWMIGSTSSPLYSWMALAMSHLTIWLSMKSVV